MKLETTVEEALFDGVVPIAESGEFAVFALANDTYTLVHRHAAVDWQAMTISGDGLFRVAEQIGDDPAGWPRRPHQPIPLLPSGPGGIFDLASRGADRATMETRTDYGASRA